MHVLGFMLTFVIHRINCDGINCDGINCHAINFNGINFDAINFDGINCHGLIFVGSKAAMRAARSIISMVEPQEHQS